MSAPEEHIIDAIYRVVLERKAAPPDQSYTSSLMTRGLDTILKKVGEEATEVVIAGKGGSREQIIYETADLLYHLLVLLGYRGITPGDVYAELGRRFGMSGITEKAARPAP